MTRPRRLHALEYVGLRQYFLTICAYQSTRCFILDGVVEETALHFLQVATDERFEMLAYCFMPDHVHALVSACAESADLQRFVRLAKQRSGFAFKRAHRERLWQESYFDRTVRDNESTVEIIHYIVANPVRTGLVETPAAYPHWGSQVYSREEILEFIAIERRV